MARTSACQSWRAFPFAWGSLAAGRHFMPVARDRHVRTPSRSVTMPLRGTHSCRPLSLTAGFLLAGSSPNRRRTKSATAFGFATVMRCKSGRDTLTQQLIPFDVSDQHLAEPLKAGGRNSCTATGHQGKHQRATRQAHKSERTFLPSFLPSPST
ncbi:hypothetical protein CCHR01_07848 [Colletotrichum chrysophilum]|uniref:Uncharacterized protein n=1 Tax=Colletotrichum chrysophilum TaxID=1836956 RepID=A0AAD9ALI2_9PEZI|nr:hypothetical protein CCHR01_07848 [Colletotrichum chrysophilum]